MTPTGDEQRRAAAASTSHAASDPSITHEAREKILNRLKRLEGQVRGLQRMVEEERACHDILTLYSGIRSALDATADLVLEQYVRECQAEAATAGERTAEVIKAVRLARG